MAKDDKQAERQAEAGNERVQAAMDKETERGYRGDSPDPTPNEAYTVEGVTKRAPTPETDAALAREVRLATAPLGDLSRQDER